MRRLLSAGVIFLAGVVSQAQSDPKALTFEVASIKPNNDSAAPRTFALQPGGRVTITAYTPFQLIAIAYDSKTIQTRGQIVGGPDWLRSDRFDFVAKANAGTETDATGRPTRLLEMLRSLLEDRFHLRMHTEMRDAPVYSLTLANNDGRPGRQLHRSAQDCLGPVENVVPPDSPRWCGWRGFGTGHYRIQGLTMEDFARGLASAWDVGRPVLDRTGLSGKWDLQIDFIPTFVSGPNADAPVPNPAADSGPGMLTAMRDQLGLKLQAGRAKVEYLVIDQAERPTPD